MIRAPLTDKVKNRGVLHVWDRRFCLLDAYGLKGPAMEELLEDGRIYVFFEAGAQHWESCKTSYLDIEIPGLTTIHLEPQVAPIAMKTIALLLVSLLTVHSQYTVDDDGNYQFSCQHGPSECYGNRVQACALAELSDNMDLQVEFVNCAMSSANSSTSGPICAAKLGIHYPPVQDCVDGNIGDQLTVYNGNRTTSFSPKYAYVPWVAINGVHNNETKDTARKDLLATICKLLNYQPESCLKNSN
uniref:Gamma-interferon-inducible lysosomal thiol reductase n=1 Tax=Timema bartmani TaxID=61472 RepID=A0A7R9I7D1_9NEOP|nr:unnamed protein product [Timema bartmani]